MSYCNNWYSVPHWVISEHCLVNNWKVTIVHFRKFGQVLITCRVLISIILISGEWENLALFRLGRDDNWSFSRERKWMCLCRLEWINFPGPVSWAKGDPVGQMRLGWAGIGYLLEELTSWENADLDNKTSCFTSIERQITWHILMVSKDYLINFEHEGINHICLAYEVA